MKILTDEKGNILVIGIANDGVEYEGEVSQEILNTFALGKYKFIDGKFVENLEFIMPEFAV